MKHAMLLVISLLLINAFGGDTINVDSIYQEYKREAASLDQAVAESYHNYFKHDSVKKAWNKRSTDIPEAIACIIRSVAIKDSIDREETRLALVQKYKIREAQEYIAKLDSPKSKEINLASAY